MTSGLFKAVTNPSSGFKKRGIYQPRLTYTERPLGQYRKSYELAIELSLPKLMFNDSFTELTDDTFVDVVKKLSETIRTTYSIWLFPHLLVKAGVRKIDYSKNIIFTDYTPVSSIVSSISKADISRVYDTQNTNFKNGGHIYHIHSNSLDVAMYDKIADLKQSKVSEKRSYEKDNYTQLSLLDELEKKKPVTVARFEVRLNGKRKIRNELSAIGITDNGLTFKEMFSTDISRKMLLRHWNNIFDRIPKVPLDGDTPEQLLLNITKAEPDMKAREALAVVTLKLLSKDHEERYIRNLMETLFSPSQYRRLRHKSREPPNATQLKTLIHVTNALRAMTPVSIDDYL
ncbi:MAG: hypothetical protein WDZ34_01790 [Candidatus Saccharimonadales bacterium]